MWARLRLLSVLLLFLAGFMPASSLFAQFHTTGADPLMLHWRRLNRPMWRIDVDSAAVGWALCADSVLSYAVPRINADFPSTAPHTFDVVVHNRHAYTNGLVALAPKRLEAYAYDVGQTESVPWVSHLLVHEYRHIMQMQTLDNGFTHFLRCLFGEQGVGLIAGLYVPSWILEGDAVWSETNYTSGGRGRRGAFLQQMRALALHGSIPSYGQAYFGSFGVRVPDFYHQGYLTVAAVNDSFGCGIWAEALRAAGRNPFSIFPVNRTLRHNTSMRKMKLYRWAAQKWKEQWQKADSVREATDFSEIPLSNRLDYEEMLAMHPYRDGWLVEVDGPSSLRHFEWIAPDGARHTLATTTLRNEHLFSVSGDTMVWSERHIHPRWTNASESCLMMGVLTEVSRGRCRVSRLSSGIDLHCPAIAPDGAVVAAVAVGSDQRHNVVIVGWNGAVIDTLLALPDAWQIGEVVWIDKAHVAAIVQSPQGRSIVRIGLSDKSMVALFPDSRTLVRSLSVSDNSLFFTMDVDGYSDIYSLNMSSGVLSRMALSRNGLDYPVIRSGTLFVSNYSHRGYSPVAIEHPDGEAVDTIRPKPFVAPSCSASITSNALKKVGPMQLHFLPNIHSWGPVTPNVPDQSLSPTASVLSQNTHGTVQWQAGYVFDSSVDDKIRVQALIDCFYPRFSFGGRWGYHHEDYSKEESETVDGGSRIVVRRQSADTRRRTAHIETSVSLPLSMHTGQWVWSLLPSVSLEYQMQRGYLSVVEQTLYGVGRFQQKMLARNVDYFNTPDSKFFCLSPSVNVSVQRRQTSRDVHCRLGLSASLTHDMAPWGDDYGSLTSLSLSAFLPGIGRHHSMMLSGSWQHKKIGAANASASGHTLYNILSDRVGVPVGLNRLSGKETSLARFTYAAPLLNPDLELGPVLFVKRIVARAFVDYGYVRLWKGGKVNGTSHRQTVGLDVYADTRWLMHDFPVSLGGRVICNPATSAFSSEFLFSVSFR